MDNEFKIAAGNYTEDLGIMVKYFDWINPDYFLYQFNLIMKNNDYIPFWIEDSLLAGISSMFCHRYFKYSGYPHENIKGYVENNGITLVYEMDREERNLFYIRIETYKNKVAEMFGFKGYLQEMARNLGSSMSAFNKHMIISKKELK